MDGKNSHPKGCRQTEDRIQQPFTEGPEKSYSISFNFQLHCERVLSTFYKQETQAYD